MCKPENDQYQRRCSKGGWCKVLQAAPGGQLNRNRYMGLQALHPCATSLVALGWNGKSSICWRECSSNSYKPLHKFPTLRSAGLTVVAAQGGQQRYMPQFIANAFCRARCSTAISPPPQRPAPGSARSHGCCDPPHSCRTAPGCKSRRPRRQTGDLHKQQGQARAERGLPGLPTQSKLCSEAAHER
jgi:hypothetical protein